MRACQRLERVSLLRMGRTYVAYGNLEERRFGVSKQPATAPPTPSPSLFFSAGPLPMASLATVPQDVLGQSPTLPAREVCSG